ncbi:MAG: 50S ribosomal protein L23, partial [Erysipelotrichaceae bacterium]|nr:50S ribosomal protein L23 [Erysipelotrichaceae bacterium]
FKVAKSANKIEIKNAVEEIFKVKVEKVNTVYVKPKKKRMGKYVGKTKAIHKAIVKIAAGQDIDLFADNTEK